MEYYWYDFVGNIGVALILISYLLVQLNKLDTEKPIYSVANAFGAFLILISLYFDFNLSAFIIESFWLLFSIIGLIKLKLKKNNFS